jgi:diaminohydroxyphosphoribosylaminopyrimidine deaminase/5-amino-6-(5-phosphoribosylamino)uracil reductase
LLLCADFSRRILYSPLTCKDMELISHTTETIAGKRRPNPESDDERFMLRALDLAERGRRTASPNPVVGAVIVDGGQIIGEGFHMRAGEPHAEVHAIEKAGARARGATMYVTLEPCAHQGRTPPCADLVVEAGLSRVVIAMVDPNPLVAGCGAGRMAGTGIDVVEGPYRAIAACQNETYMKWIATRRPFVTLKMAMSLDGKVATRTGDSRWVSSDGSREDVHMLRAESDAVMVGIGTVLADDPLLTARDVGAPRQPLRVVLDSSARTPLESKVCNVGEARTLLAVGREAPAERLDVLREHGIDVFEAAAGPRVDIPMLLDELGRREITSVLAEGGPTVAAALCDQGLVDKLVFYVAPRLVGGAAAPGPLGGEGVAFMEAAAGVEIDSVLDLAPDLKVVAYPSGRKNCSPE